jgi:5'(3')-deoxyribonucleotidase
MKQLFLDCDGVLADFDTAAERIFGLPPRQAEEKLGTPRFWADLRSEPGFYRNLALMPGARRLFDGVKHLSPVILTGCPLGGWAEPQKLAWAGQHFPGTPMIACMAKDKRNHMKPGDVLVDDYLKYRHRWEEAGGVFIHYRNADDAIAEVLAVFGNSAG